MPLTKKLSKDKTVCKVAFSLPVEITGGAKKLLLAGEFNAWKPTPMRKANGSFSLSVELPTGANYQYRFVTDTGMWINDTDADCYVYSPHAEADNSVVVL
ncbi:MAG: isoamylase early set domain-containing protein [Humidesulfovibrio sp.]|nr:isoamylase early set domain-containing protein [Humidesulfovibrio sp.]